MKTILIFLLAFLILNVITPQTQEPPKPKCPTMVRVEPPNQEQLKYDNWTFRAIVEGFDATQVSYHWTVYIGHDQAQVDSGQGTELITIKRVDEWPKKGVTVVLDVGGLPEGCSKRATWSIIS